MVRTRGLSWAMFWAVVSYIVTMLGTALTEYLTSFTVTPLQGSLISTGVGLAVVLIGVLIDQARSGGTKQNPPTAGPQQWPPRPDRPQPRRGRRTSWVAAILLVLLLCGGGGLAVTYAGHWVVQKAIERVSGADKDNPGRERLASEVTKTQGILRVTVTSVQVNDRATVVKLVARNAGQEAVTMSGGGLGQLNVPGQGTLKRDPFAGDWDQGEVPAGGEYSGTMVFDGKIGPEFSAATLAFTSIFSMGGNAPRNMSIDLPLVIEAVPLT